MLAINLHRKVGVALVAENRGGAGIGVEQAKILRRKGERPRRVGQLGDVVQVKRAARLGKQACTAAKNQGAEFEARVDVWEKPFSILKIKECR